MNQLGITCFMLVVINTQARPGGENQNDLSGQGTADKRWIQGGSSFGASNGFSSFKNPVTDQDSAKIEPTFKDYRAYDILQNVLINVLHPTPIVDGIQEHEKYGNDGSQHEVVGKAVVQGSETISKFLNAAIDAPKTAVKKVAQGATQALNQLGAKLIGL